MFDFASPSSYFLNLIFFYGYSIYMYFINYSAVVNWYLVYTLYSILIIWNVIVFFGMYCFGVLFIYEAIISIIYNISFVMVCINFDAYIVDIVYKVGFIIDHSREKKFEILFLCLSLFASSLLLFLTIKGHQWADQ